MWLLLDIGNSSVKAGLYAGPKQVQTFRMATDPTASVVTYRHSLRHHLDGTTPTRVGISSVVPVLTQKIADAVRQEMMVLPEVLHTGLKLPFAMHYQTPKTLGIDRMAGAAGGFSRFGTGVDGQPRPVVVVDAGTAVNYEVIDTTPAYLGGAIAPGLDLLINSLSRGTAQLPKISRIHTRRAIGRNTREALQSGLILGYLGGVRDMLNRLCAAFKDTTPVVVATGGDGPWLAKQLSMIDAVSPDLVLEGIRCLLTLNES